MDGDHKAHCNNTEPNINTISEAPMAPDSVQSCSEWLNSDDALPCIQNSQKTLEIPSNPFAGRDIVLSIEGGQQVFYRGKYVTQIPMTRTPILFGRRDIMSGHYPDVDLALFFKQDTHISRSHLKIYRDCNGVCFVEDLCGNNTTFLNSRTHCLNKERAELAPGDRIFISNSIVVRFCVL